MSLHIFNDPNYLAFELAEEIVKDINYCLRHKGRCSLVLSGGSTPQLLYKVLAKQFSTSVDWHKVDFFWGDERCVPYNDSRNNATMAYQDLLLPLGILPENIYRMNTTEEPEKGAEEYEALLKSYFRNNEEYCFDIVLLGMGADGHTLSVFPESPLIENEEGWVKNIFNKNDGLQRITLLPVVVNASRWVYFLVSGQEKAQTLNEVLNGAYNPKKYPAQIINSERLFWYLDRDAAKEILS